MRAFIKFSRNQDGTAEIHACAFMTDDVVSLKTNHDYDLCQQALRQWEAGDMIQKAFDFMDDTEREFMITGMDAETQKEIFG